MTFHHERERPRGMTQHRAGDMPVRDRGEAQQDVYSGNTHQQTEARKENHEQDSVCKGGRTRGGPGNL